jgi:hypothetical protein
MGDVLGKFIDPVRRIFPTPKSSEGHEDEFFGAYLDALISFDDATLELAARTIVGTRTARSFPLPSECSVACKDAFNQIEYRRRVRPDNSAEIRNTPIGQRDPACSEARQRLADDLIQCPLGIQASEEGWISRLWDFCRDAGRLPGIRELDQIIAKHKAAEKDWETWKENGLVPGFMLRARSAIVSRREHLSSIARKAEQ